ncbi:transcriptional regulator YeiL [Gottschalkiaceae bacterium SANA]|nr:transcriptional regulator YeiL [Gottschalkiaceae bacterium SANA]
MVRLNKQQQVVYGKKYSLLQDIMSKDNWDNGVFCSFSKGEYLFQEGDLPKGLYLLVEGKCRVSKTVESGKTFLINHYEGLSVIGEVELFDPREYQSSVQALEKSVCFVLGFRECLHAMMEDLPLMRFIAEQLCWKVERSDRNTSINLTYSLKQRLSSYILYAQKQGLFSSNYTHLANHLGCSHRHLLRTLKGFCDDKILEKKQGQYRILDEEELQEQAGDEFYFNHSKV